MTNWKNGGLKLSCVTALAILIWTIFLPKIGEWESVRNRIETNRKAGIDPTAIFYTDHPSMKIIEKTIETRVNSRSRSFWRSSFKAER